MSVANPAATGLNMTQEQEITWQDRAAARYMPLAGGPSSQVAEALVEAIFRDVVLPTLSTAPRQTSISKYKRAIGALLADLFRFHEQGRGGKHGMSASDFSSKNLGFGYDVFRRVNGALGQAGLLQFKRGWKRAEAGFEPGSIVRTGGDLSFFRLYSSLLELAGRTASEPWGSHWRAGQPKAARNAPILQVRAKKQEGQSQGTLMPIDVSSKEAALLLADLNETNAFLLQSEIEGIAFVGLKRVFNDGDQPQKLWRRGGRYFSMRGGDAYERMDGQTRRSQIRMAGEAVAEVDISASHLTILYGIRGLPFDASSRDPYEVNGMPRLPAKLWVTSSLGKGMAESTRWSPRSGRLYKEEFPERKLGKDYKASEVRRAVIQRHPLLHELAETGLASLDLQWHESDILRIAMYELRENDIPSLPVHDSLIVPLSKVGDAQEAIRRGFMFHFESKDVVPRLSVKGA